MGIRTHFDKSRSTKNSIRMKLLAAFLTTAALADDRTFADRPEFMLDSTAWSESYAAERMTMLEENTEKYFETYVPANGSAAVQRVTGKMVRFLQNARSGMQRVSNRQCHGGRSRRSADDNTERYVVPENNAQKAFWQLFYQHANWARNVIYTSDKRNCKKFANTYFKRFDRFQQIWAWQYCSKIDDSPQFCDWAYDNGKGGVKGHPRQGTYMNNKYGKDVNVEYQAIGCEHAKDGDQNAKLRCPLGGYLQIVSAKYGREGKGICSASGHAGIQKPCDSYVDVTDYADRTCGGQTECDLKVGNSITGTVYPRQDPCHGVPKYTRVNFVCVEERPPQPDDGYEIACEHPKTETMKMTCDAGKKIQVTVAEYGRWSSKTCGAHKTASKECGKQVDVYADASSKCDGKSECSYRANNATPGEVSDVERQDPCRGVAKYTRVKYECV